MVEMYCMKCKKKQQATEVELSGQNSRNKMYVYKGKCTVCGGKMAIFSKAKLN